MVEKALPTSNEAHVDPMSEKSSDARSVLSAPTETLPATIIEEPTASPPVVQDGGLKAWLQVLGCFFLWFNLWGYTFAFGTFQNYYEREYLVGTNPSAIAWIGSIQSFLLIISGLWTGPLFDWGFYMYMIVAGACLSTLGAFMLSLSNQFWQIFLTQGVCIGLGCGALFIPSMALISRAFVKNRAIAVGLTTCGAPVGGIIYTLLFEAVIHKYGFAWTARILGFFMLGTYCLAIPLLLLGAENAKSLSAGQTRRLFDKAALRDLPFWLYTGSIFLSFMAYLVPYFYMPSYAQSILGVTQSRASYALTLSQAASVPGRLIASLAANYFGVMVTWSGCAIMSGIIVLSWASVGQYTSFALFCAFYGAFSGPLVPLPPSIFPVVCPDLKVLGTRLGMAQSISAFANLLGPPIAGAILRAGGSSERRFLGVQLFTGLLLLCSTGFMFSLWRALVVRRGAKIWT